jgi:regulator of cell morphogenesis and NO signaling
MAQTTTAPSPRATLGELVAEQPSRARVLEGFGIDYCCHGQRTLGDACREAGLEEDAVLKALASIVEEAPSDVDGLVTAELAERIVDTHHAYLHRELEPLQALAEKVHSVHGERHPELAEVAALVRAARRDLEPHLAREEDVVFPALEALPEGASAAAGTQAEIRQLVDEHRALGELLGRLREVTGDYAVPGDACASYTMLYGRLEHLEHDTFRHIHLENNVLFPAVGVSEPATA